jgi:hypothetical protein
MIVVSVVALLTWLAMVVIGRIQQRAALSLIENNLRQLYQAKEYYFSETDAGLPTSIPALAAKGYLSASVKDRLMNSHSFEANKGWHYYPLLVMGAPVAAYQGTKQAGFAPKGEVIYYPGPPNSPVDVFGIGSAIGVPTSGGQPPTVKPPVGTQQPGVLVPPVNQPPVVTPPSVVPPPNTQAVNQPPQAIQAPKPADSTTTAVQPNPSGNQANGPGNSAFGQGQGKGKGNNGPNKP